LSMPSPAKITRDDLENKLREISGEVEEKTEAVKPQLMSTAVAAVVVVAAVSYLLGRRKGRKRSAVVEIRRV
jgi:hypothetical protein